MVSLTLHTILDNVCLRTWLPMPESTPSALWYMPYIYRSLTAGMHKNQSQRNLSTISCRLSTHSYNIYFSLFYSFKKFFKYLSVFVSLLFKMVWEVFHLSFPFVLWQLKNIQHHGYWFLMTDSLLMVCPPSGFHRSQSSRRRGRDGHRKRWWKVWGLLLQKENYFIFT